MAELIVLGYDGRETARRAYVEVLTLQRDDVVDLQGIAGVDVDAYGKTHVETPQSVVGASAASGALWGMLLGLLFFVPYLGFSLGGAMGVVMSKIGQSGIDETFRGQARDLLQPGRSAVVVMAASVIEDEFAAALGPYGGEVLRTSLSDADERELAHEVSGNRW